MEYLYLYKTKIQSVRPIKTIEVVLTVTYIQTTPKTYLNFHNNSLDMEVPNLFALFKQMTLLVGMFLFNRKYLTCTLKR